MKNWEINFPNRTTRGFFKKNVIKRIHQLKSIDNIEFHEACVIVIDITQAIVKNYIFAKLQKQKLNNTSIPAFRLERLFFSDSSFAEMDSQHASSEG